MAIRINRITTALTAFGPPLSAVIDFSAQPYSVGDLITLLVGAGVVATERRARRIDLCLVSDPGDRSVDPAMAAFATRDNHLQRLMALLPVVELCPGLGTLHLFTRRTALLEHLDDDREGATLWPSRVDLEDRRYLYYDVLKLVHRHHSEGGRVPTLGFNSEARRWAGDFFSRLAPGRVPVTVNLRNNPGFHGHRNSILPAWREFFLEVAARHPVSFFIVGAPAEMDASIRACPHVVYSKDHHTDLMQDLVLIAEAPFHLGASSGPATIPLFGGRPYYFFNADVLPHLDLYDGALVHSAPGEVRFSFAAPLQAFGVAEESPGLLLQEFERIWASRDWPAALAGAGT